MATRSMTVQKPLGEPLDHGRFAGAAQRQISDADDDGVDAMAGKAAGVETAISPLHRPGIRELGHAQNAAQHSRPRTGAPAADHIAKSGSIEQLGVLAKEIENAINRNRRFYRRIARIPRAFRALKSLELAVGAAKLGMRQLSLGPAGTSGQKYDSGRMAFLRKNPSGATPLGAFGPATPKTPKPPVPAAPKPAAEETASTSPARRATRLL